MKRWIGFMVCLFLSAVVLVSPSPAQEAPALVVGRIYYIEGDLLRYVPEEEDWVPVVRDTPFGTDDTLFSGSRGMAELIIPNGAWIRIGNSTQVQFLSLDNDLTEMDVASGVARIYNKSSDTVIKVTSPFGFILAYPGTVVDYYVGDNSVEAVAVRGKVSFVHQATEAKYELAAGSPSILADQQQVSSGEGSIDPEWDRWNRNRENFWAAKARVRGRSVEYLPPNLQNEAYALEENGSWEMVPYEGTSRWFWRPRVAAGWSPFTVGRWTDWYGDQTWIPAEPFGYVTHHYGNWINVRDYWYWAPPVVSLRVGLPLLDVGFYWYPGRVSWIHTATNVGWVPLAPRETYYSYRNWGGPHTVVVNNLNITRISLNVRNYAYGNRAIVVSRNNFYDVNNYTKVRVNNINPASIINNYKAAPVISNTVIKNYTTIRERYNYTNATVKEKPHNTVINRIRQNESIIHQQGGKEKAPLVRQQVNSIPEGRVNREAKIEKPRVTNNIVSVDEVNRPKSEIKLQQREIRSTGGAGKAEGQPAQPGQPPARPERTAPGRPPQTEQPAAKPERMAPVRPPQPEQPAPRPERTAPTRPPQPEQPRPPAVPERLSPARSAPPEQPAPRPERTAPARPPQPEQPRPPAVPERLSPAKPAPPEQPAPRPERTAPAKPPQPEQPRPPAVPERLSPARPAPQEQPAARPERTAPARPPQPEQPRPPAVPERLSPAKPAPPEQPVPRPERTAPARPPQPQQPRPPAVQERVSPAKPAQPEQVAPAKPPEREAAEKQRERKPPEQFR